MKDPLDHDNLGTGKQCGDGGFDEIPGLRASRERTNFSIYRFRPEGRDTYWHFCLGVFGTLIMAAMHLRKLKILYFPVFIDECDEQRGRYYCIYLVCESSVRNAPDFKCCGGQQMALFEVRNLTFTYPGSGEAGAHGI